MHLSQDKGYMAKDIDTNNHFCHLSCKLLTQLHNDGITRFENGALQQSKGLEL